MTDWKKLLGHYVLPSARPTGYEPGSTYIDNLVLDDLGREVLAVLNERFKGVKGIEYSLDEVPKPGEPIRFSNTPRAIAINQILDEFGLSINLLSPQDVLLYWRALPERSSTYSDTNSILLGFKPGPNEKLRRLLMKDLSIISANESFLIQGLGIEKSNDKYGFAIRNTDRMRPLPVSLLREFAEKCGVPFDYEDSGLRGVYRDWDDLNAYWYGSLVGADGGGRVQVLRAA